MILDLLLFKYSNCLIMQTSAVKIEIKTLSLTLKSFIKRSADMFSLTVQAKLSVLTIVWCDVLLVKVYLLLIGL